ncbi:protein phosphatase 2C domain-containing protein [Streptomyces sp. NPDC093094]|uniref:protein phosphatase 2C domain-containing protein n=1 Tax=Streptomyces sp. NPDC093094 TaxID=3366026 RepID=UPI0038185E68
MGSEQSSSTFTVGDRQLRDESFTQPDWCAAYGGVGQYAVVGASALGRQHSYNGRPREDAFAARSDGRWLAVAVADGVGSRPHSRYGATLCAERLADHLLQGAAQCQQSNDLPHAEPVVQAEGLPPASDSAPDAGESSLLVEALVAGGPLGEFPPALEPSVQRLMESSAEHAATLTWNRRLPGPASLETAQDMTPAELQALVRAAFVATRDDLDNFAESRGLTARDLSCALLGVVLDTHDGRGAGGHIGDGAIAVLDHAHAPRPLVDPPAPAEPGAVYAISHPRWETYLATAPFTAEPGQPPPSLLLMTDGVSVDHLYPPPEGVYEQACRDIQAQLSGLPPGYAALKLVHWLATYRLPGSFDDRTLVAVLSDRETISSQPSTPQPPAESTPVSHQDPVPPSAVGDTEVPP